MLTQIFLSVFGIAAILLVSQSGRMRVWGFACGLISQPAWFITSYQNAQWGIFAMSLVYTGSWIYGLHKSLKEVPDGR